MNRDGEESAPVLIDGEWRLSSGEGGFRAADPRTGTPLRCYPVSDWPEINLALDAGRAAQAEVARDPGRIAAFLELLARLIDESSQELVDSAALETALPSTPRLGQVELPRTVAQLQEAGAAARDRSWVEATLDPSRAIASYLAPIPGTTVVMGPNNFPFAFNGIGGGDFAAAIATGHSVIAKANRGHPGTTLLLAQLALKASGTVGMPPATVQLVYAMSRSDGLRLVGDDRVAATAFTGSREAGLALKAAADARGRPIYLEMSSVNPVVVLPGALGKPSPIVTELAGSMLSASGQMCTNPGIVFVPVGPAGSAFRAALSTELQRMGTSTLLGTGVVSGLEQAVHTLRAAGATIVHQAASQAEGCHFPLTLLEVDGKDFLANPTQLQTEAFGNVSLIVCYAGAEELVSCLTSLNASLTGTIYSAVDLTDDGLYEVAAPILRGKVGRLLNDKPPTGVAVVPSMVHGGPYPAAGHPGFTGVGIPGSLRRFAMLQCFDNVADRRLPPELQAGNPLGLQRRVNGEWTRDPAGAV